MIDIINLISTRMEFKIFSSRHVTGDSTLVDKRQQWKATSSSVAVPRETTLASMLLLLTQTDFGQREWWSIDFTAPSPLHTRRS